LVGRGDIQDILGEMDKQKIKDKILKDNQEVYLSAQDYARLSNDGKKQLREILKQEGKDPDLYEEKMRRMFPKEVKLPPLKWRKR